ncbi:hypothetical protein D3C76_1060260 [compost metagenome]
MILKLITNITLLSSSNNGRSEHDGWIISTLLLLQNSFFKASGRNPLVFLEYPTEIIAVRIANAVGNFLQREVCGKKQMLRFAHP